MDQLDGVGVVDLGAQAADRHIHHVGVAVEVHLPDVRGNQCARQHFALAADQQVQQGKLLVGQGESFAVTRHPATQQVQLQIGHLVVLHLTDGAAAQQAAYPSQQLGVGEGLDQVGVGAQFQPLDAILNGIAGGEEQHRHLAVTADALQQLPAVQARQHDIQDDQRELELCRQVLAIQPVVSGLHGITGLAQRLAQVIGCLGFVFHYQDTHRLPLPGWRIA